MEMVQHAARLMCTLKWASVSGGKTMRTIRAAAGALSVLLFHLALPDPLRAEDLTLPAYESLGRMRRVAAVCVCATPSV